MQSRFWLVTAGAMVVGLLTPMFEGDSNSAVFRSMFWNLAAIIKLERHHEVPTSIRINIENFCGWKTGSRLEMVCGSPIIDGPLVLKKGVQFTSVGRAQLGTVMP